MKEYLKQFYSEGFATLFFQKPKDFINRKIKNKSIRKLLNSLLIVIYTILVLSFAGFIFYRKIK